MNKSCVQRDDREKGAEHVTKALEVVGILVGHYNVPSLDITTYERTTKVRRKNEGKKRQRVRHPVCQWKGVPSRVPMEGVAIPCANGVAKLVQHILRHDDVASAFRSHLNLKNIRKEQNGGQQKDVLCVPVYHIQVL